MVLLNLGIAGFNQKCITHGEVWIGEFVLLLSFGRHVHGGNDDVALACVEGVQNPVPWVGQYGDVKFLFGSNGIHDVHVKANGLAVFIAKLKRRVRTHGAYQIAGCIRRDAAV